MAKAGVELEGADSSVWDEKGFTIASLHPNQVQHHGAKPVTILRCQRSSVGRGPRREVGIEASPKVWEVGSRANDPEAVPMSKKRSHTVAIENRSWS